MTAHRPKPTVPEVLPLARAIYLRDGGGAGCCLHVVLDDNNVGAKHVEGIEAAARERGHEDCAELAALLARMSTSQRRRISEADLLGRMVNGERVYR